jgi:prepilin-type N-terminal cleavage/methylation domain-containing protein
MTASKLGFTLMEIIAALVIASLVSVIGIQYLRPSGDTSKQKSCDLAREMLQNDAQRYFEVHGVMPAADLNQLASPEYSGALLPTCPVTDQAYRLDRNNTVICPTHESTRNN